MSATSELTRRIWLWLLTEGGAHTAAEIAMGCEQPTDDVFYRLQGMAQKGQVKKLLPAQSGERRIRYGVTGTCGIPQGMRVAEVQAC